MDRLSFWLYNPFINFTKETSQTSLTVRTPCHNPASLLKSRTLVMVSAANQKVKKVLDILLILTQLILK